MVGGGGGIAYYFSENEVDRFWSVEINLKHRGAGTSLCALTIVNNLQHSLTIIVNGLLGVLELAQPDY